LKKRSSLLQNFHRILNQNLQPLVIFYVLILLLFLLLSDNRFFTGELDTAGFNNFLYIPLAVFFCYILVFFLINIISIAKNTQRSGIEMIKKRMVGYFILILLLSSLPLSILSYRFTNASLDYWLDEDLTQVLVENLDFNLGYYQEQLEDLERLARTKAFQDVDLSSSQSALPLWEKLQLYNSSVDAMQVVTPEGEIWLLGDELARVAVDSDLMPNAGFLSRRDLEEYSVLSYQFFVIYNDQIYRTIISSLYPREYNQIGRDLSRLLEKQESFNEFRVNGRWNVLKNMMFFILPLLLLSVNIGFALSQRIVDPLDRLEKAMDRVTAGDYSYRLAGGYTEELSHIVGAFNQMINELELFRAKVEQSGRVGAWKDLAQQLAHEIRNPLTPIKLSAQRIQKKISQEKDPDNIILPAMDRILSEVNSLDYLLKEFRDFAGQKAPVMEKTELYGFLKDVRDRYEASYPDITIGLNGEAPFDILVDRSQFMQVIKNLLDNAINAMEGKGNIVMGLYRLPRGNSEYVRIVIQDSGPGIPEEQRTKIFQPYYTTRKEGTGLGLAIVERIINDHRGRIWLVSTSEGTTFTMDLPVGVENENDTDN